MFGWKDGGEKLLQLTREGRWKEMNTAISDVMLDEFVVSAPYGEIALKLRERFHGLVDRITLPVPEDPAHDALAFAEIASLRS